MKPRSFSLTFALLALCAGSLRGQSGDGSLDPSFQPSDLQGGVLATQSDGSVLLTIRSGSTHKLARLHPDGTLDPAFPAGVINGLVSTVRTQADDHILIAGSFTSVGGAPAGPIARLNPDGSLDSTFTPPGGGGFVGRIEPLEDGKILTVASDSRGLVRLNPDGSPDPTFAVDPSLTFTPNPPIALQDGGQLIVGYVPADGSVRLARLNPGGSIDPTFQFPADALKTVAGLPQLAPGADGQVLVYGATVIGDNLDPANYTPFLRRFNADGSADATFLPVTLTGAPLNGSNQRPGIAVAVTGPDGKIIIGGNFTGVDGTPEPGLARLNADGSLDPDFTPGDGQFGGDGGVPAFVNDVLFQGNGLLVTGLLQGAPASEGEEGHGVGTARLLTGLMTLTPPPASNLADLAGKVSGFKARFSADGSKLKIKGDLTVKNTGQVTAKNVEIGAFVSADGVHRANDVRLAEISLRQFGYKKVAKNGGKAGPILFSYKVPAAAAAALSGKYVVLVIDPDNAIDEANEKNNAIVLGPLP